jgi:hypothetical protein
LAEALCRLKTPEHISSPRQNQNRFLSPLPNPLASNVFHRLSPFFTLFHPLFFLQAFSLFRALSAFSSFFQRILSFAGRLSG